MAIPDYQAIMAPLMDFVSDRAEHSLRETIEALAVHFGLTDQERQELLPSGQQATFDNRVGWARTYLKKAGLLESTRRGYFRITERGVNVLMQKPAEINRSFLLQFPEFVDFQQPHGDREASGARHDVAQTQTPEEQIESVALRLRNELATELLQTIQGLSPAFFERLVVDLLVRMGYGGTRQDAGQAIGHAGDGGIDGIIKEDRLGLDIVYIQAKRWTSTVGRPQIQQFTGALQGQRARKGVFLTTSDFSQSARDYVSQIESKIVLIDGDTLAHLMIDYGIGVATVASYEVKRVDSDYFTEE